MKKKITKYFKTISLISLLLIFSCSKQLMVTKIGEITELNQIKKVPSIIGIVQFPQAEFNLKTDTIDILKNSTVSLISNQEQTLNNTLATGTTDDNGKFTIYLTNNLVINTGDAFVLEALKRIDSEENNNVTIRTYIRWNGSGWESMTNQGVYINSITTALSLIAAYNYSTISISDTINKIDTYSGTSVPLPVGNITAQTIIDVSNLVNTAFLKNDDPFSLIKFNGNYFIDPQNILGKLIETKSCISCDLSELDLSKINLANVDLSYANLSNQNLFGKDLSGSKLFKSNISNADLSNADISNVDLQEANLNGSILNNVDFSYSNLSNRDLSTLTFFGTNLTDVNLSNSNLRSIDLSKTILINTNFTGANLADSNLADSNLSTSNFTSTNLSEAYLAGSNLQGLNLSNSNLKYSILLNSNLESVNLNGADLSNATWTNGSICQENSIGQCIF